MSWMLWRVSINTLSILEKKLRLQFFKYFQSFFAECLKWYILKVAKANSETVPINELEDRLKNMTKHITLWLNEKMRTAKQALKNETN